MKLCELIENLQLVDFYKKEILRLSSERFEGSFYEVEKLIKHNKMYIEKYQKELNDLLLKETN